jgi:hypothetical protein
MMQTPPKTSMRRPLQRTPRAARRSLALLAALMLAACTSSGGTVAPTSSTTPPSLPPGGFQVASLGLRFTLPTSFTAVANPDFVFLARSKAPPAVFSIDGDTPAVVTQPARNGETLSSIALGGLKNVVVTHAAVSGLPTGIDSNELLVADKGESFSVILSAPAAQLPEIWQTFIASVHVDPA